MGVTLYGSEGRAQLVGQIIYRPIDPLERDIEKNRQCQGEYRRCTEESGMDTRMIAARNGGEPRAIKVKKRKGVSILDKPDYDGGRR